MIDPIKTVSSSPSSTADRRGSDHSTPQQQAQPAKAAEPVDQPLRLVIEPANGAGQGYTYKLYDRSTGALLIELPREEAQKMSETPGYTAGQLFSAKV